MVRSKRSAESKGTAAKAKPSEDGFPLDTTVAEDTIAAPRPSRKRAGDFFDFDGEDQLDGAVSSKATTAKPVKPKKKTKTAPVAGDKTKSSEIDDPSIEAQPGGDEAGPTKPAKKGRGKAKKEETAKDPPVKSSSSTNDGGKSKESKESKAVTVQSKKRKTPVGINTDALHAQVLDPLSEHASAKKKQKKSQPSALGAASSKVSDTLSSALGTTSQILDAAKNHATDVANGAQTSILGDVTEVAEAVVEEKGKAAASVGRKSKAIPKDKGKGKAKEADQEVAEASSTAANLDTSTQNKAAPAEGEDEEEFEEDDQAPDLLKGFHSGDDDDDISGDEGFEQGQEVPKVPRAKKPAKKLKAAKDEVDGPGVVYVGRIPHGFYEHEMRAYFSQFGPITRLRLSRNRKSGKSKHYGFIEFESATVAKIVADTMNNYLLFGHILKCKLALPEQLHPDLWKGANKRFKAVPWNKIEGRKLEMAMGREGWEKRIGTERKRRADKNEATKDLGYEYDAGELKGVDEVPVREETKEIDGKEPIGDEVIQEETTVVTEAQQDGIVKVSEETRTTRVKRVPKGKGKEIANDAAAPVAKITKKAKTAKATTKEEATSALEKTQDIASAVQEQAVSALGTTKSVVQQTVSSLLETAQNVTSSIQEQVAPVVEKTKKTKTTVQKQTASVIGKAQDVASTVQDQAASTFDNAKGAVEQAINSAPETTQDATSSIREQAAPVVKKARKAKANIQKQTAPAIEKAQIDASAVQGQAASALEAPKGAVEQIITPALETSQGATASTHEQIAPVVKKAKKAKTTIQNQTGPTATKAESSTVQEQATSALETGRDAVQKTAATALETGQNIISTVQEQAAPVVKKARNPRAPSQKKTESAVEKTQDVLVQEQVASALEIVKDAVEQSSTRALEASQNATLTVQDQAAPAAKKTKRPRAKADDEATSVAKKVKETVADESTSVEKKSRKGKKKAAS